MRTMKLKLFIVLLLLGSLHFCKAQSFVVDESDSRGPIQERYVAKFNPD